jgi:hypothetical protein
MKAVEEITLEEQAVVNLVKNLPVDKRRKFISEFNECSRDRYWYQDRKLDFANTRMTLAMKIFYQENYKRF